MILRSNYGQDGDQLSFLSYDLIGLVYLYLSKIILRFQKIYFTKKK